MRVWLLTAGLLWSAAAWAAGPAPGAGHSAKELLDKVDDLYRGASSHGKMSMRVVTEHWTREMKLEFWSQGKDQSLVRILAPLKEKGTATLKSGNSIWNYLPKVNRVIKVPSSMMGGSWMGSHFTNDDLVKESRMAEDFDFAVTFEGAREGLEIIEITCTPRPEAAVVWGKVVVVLDRASELPLRSDYHDEDLELARTMTFGEVRLLGGRRVPSLMRVVPADKPREATEVRYDEVEFDLDLDAGLFSLRSLQR
ncbi:MAG TPA: outer membrane lipoprotein-sorting protein [Myxococcota bacterium]|nr:outer membrane lipoprotein-sorting protein [Myxococcota bacterium]HRY96478.1 outer membrane lipoprotein-sorting protein [Myxococcota bacterium]HSA22912.1 outer membrane lipoprotein-sorting protein [Myxococcota bacterium]